MTLRKNIVKSFCKQKLIARSHTKSNQTRVFFRKRFITLKYDAVGIVQNRRNKSVDKSGGAQCTVVARRCRNKLFFRGVLLATCGSHCRTKMKHSRAKCGRKLRVRSVNYDALFFGCTFLYL